MGHFYDKEGNPQHFVQGKNGESRDATLRDARKHHWVPGFSGIAAIMSRPGLDKWKEGQLLDAALEIGTLRFKEDSDSDISIWKREVKTLANERSLKARDRGSEIHDAIEHFIKMEEFDKSLADYIEAVRRAVNDTFSLPLSLLEAETTFSSSLGYGGMIDGLYRGTVYEHDEAHGILLDWKTKDKEFDDKTKLTFDEQGMQLAAYRHGIGLESAVCANVFISPSAKIRIHIWEEDELQRLFEKFKACLTLWQLDRKYDSGWAE